MAMSEVSSPSNSKQKMAKETTKHKTLIRDTEIFSDVSKFVSYMDHSLLIKIFYKQNTRLFISAPRMFGKSTNINMIKHFFQLTGHLEPDWKKRPQYKMFKDLNIVTQGKEEDLKNHLGAHPVVWMNFCAFYSQNSEEAIANFHYKLQHAFGAHDYYLKRNLQNEEDRKIWKRWHKSFRYTDDDRKYIETGLRDLCRFLYEAHGKKRVLVLIDDCDHIMEDGLINHYCGDRMWNANFLSTILDSILVGDVAEEMIQGVLITGVTNINGIGYTENPQLVICEFLDDTPHDATGFQRKDIIPFYSLHEDHLDGLLRKLQVELKFNDEELERKKENIKMIYGGYYTRMEQNAIYPLFYVILYIINGRDVGKYRTNLIRRYEEVLNRIGISSDLVKLCGFSDVVIESSDWKLNLKDLIKMQEDPTPSSKNVYLMLLMTTGVITYADSHECNDFKRKITVANRSARKDILEKLRESLKRRYR